MNVQRRRLTRLTILIAAATGLTLYLPARATAQSPATPPREDRSGGANRQPEQLPLEQGKPVERELRGGEVHNYRLALSAEQYLHVVVEQRGIDVVVSLFGPDDKKLAEIDSPNGTEGPEPIVTIVEQPGNYRLEVRSLENSAPAGRYQARIEALRAATAQDRTFVAVSELSKQAANLKFDGQYEQAVRLLQKAVELQEQTHGREHTRVADSLDELAGVYFQKGDYAQAEPLYQRALSIREKGLGAQHLDVAAALTSLGQLFYVRGDYVQAEQSFRRALAIREGALSAEHPDVARSLANLASTHLQKGEYVQAEPLFQRALLIFEKAVAEHPDFATLESMAATLRNMSDLYRVKGDFERAELSLQRALPIIEKTFGPESPDVAYTLISLARLYRARSELTRAAPLYQRALAIREKNLGPEHPDVGEALNSLAVLYQEQGEYDQAEPLYQRALAIYEKSLGTTHPLFAQTLSNLAVLQLLRRDYGQSESLFQRALALREKALGPRHPNVAATLARFALMYEIKGDVAKAVQLQTRNAEIREENLALILTVGSEEEKRNYLSNILAEETDLALSLHNRSAPRNIQAARLALTTVLRRKGRALDATAASVGALRQRLDPQDRALLDQLDGVRSQLATLVLKGAGAPDHREAEVAKLEAEGRRLEMEMSLHSPMFRAQTQAITLDRVRRAIPAGTALVEFVAYRPFDKQARLRSDTFGPPRYVAYVLRRDGSLRWVELGEAAAIDQDVGRLRTELANPSSRRARQIARSLDEKLMRPVRRLLGPTRRLFISPDGVLNLIPFAALVDEQNRYLLEGYSISYLTSGRDLLRLQTQSKSREKPVVIANPSFNQKITAPRDEQAPPDAAASRAMDITQMKFSPLPGTASEAAALGKMLLDVRLLTREAATEAALKQVAGPQILHVATHGFFLSEGDSVATGGTRGLSLGSGSRQPQAQPAQEQDPLLRSGLVFAGVNQLQSGPGQDGILTALEASGLDLWGTKLVVLSACETGVGDVKNGDGVYGLRRALVLAGAESQIMSMWRVSDTVTRDLMVEYYRRLTAGEGRAEALRQVQLKMLRSREKRRGSENRGILSGGALKISNVSHPFFWAAFIQTGDWRSVAIQSWQAN